MDIAADKIIEPATDADIAEVKRRLATYSLRQSFDADIVAKLIRLIECQQEELDDRANTIKHLVADEDELVEAEAGNPGDHMIFGEP